MPEENIDPEAILETARDDPDALEVAPLLAAYDAGDGTTRTLMLRSVAHLTRDDPDRVVDHAERVREALDDGYPVAEGTAALICLELAPDYPDAVRPAVPRLVEMLEEVPPRKGYRAAQALVPLLEDDATAFVPVADDLASVVEDPPEVDTPMPEELAEMSDEERKQRTETLSSRREEIQQDLSRTYGIQEFAAHALVEVANEEPEALFDNVDALRAGLNADPAAVRAASADALATLAGADPDAIDAAVDDLVALVGADTNGVQAYAIRALGQAVATEAVEPLRDLAADDDADEDLADLAAQTADFLADQR